jgi:hypothetical protein
MFNLISKLFGGKAKRTVRVKAHRRNGRRVKAYTKEIEFDPYAVDDSQSPVVQRGGFSIFENPFVKITKYTDRLNLPKGAKITHAPRFVTEGRDEFGNWATANTDGSIDITETQYKKKRR